MGDGDRGPATDWLRAGRSGPVVAAAADVAWLVVFVVLGRSSHTEGESVAGVARTLWPFVVGLASGWAVARAWRLPGAVVPTGLVVWPVCVGVAMALRALSGQGVAVAFIGVALAFVGLGLLGWRALAGVAAHRRAGGTSRASRGSGDRAPAQAPQEDRQEDRQGERP